MGGSRSPTSAQRMFADGPAPTTETTPPATAQASGDGAKQPPSVRPDGECDENANVGPRSPTRRLPDKTGSWLGEPGNSGWQSTDPWVNAVNRR
jgi:hypothetical protein